MCLHKYVTHLPRAGLQVVEAAFLVTSFKFSKHGLVVGLPGGNEVEKDSGQFVSGVLDGLEWAVACALRPVIVAQVGFVVMEGLSSHAKDIGDAVFGFDLWSADETPSAGAIFGTKIEPRGETVSGREFRQIGAELTKDGLNAEALETGYESQIDAKDTFQMTM